MASATKLDQKKNFALATTTTALGVSDTSWILTAGQGGFLPATVGGSYFAVIWDQTDSPDNPFRSSAGFEFVKVNTLTGDTVSNMDRAQQGTTAIALSVGPVFAIAAVTSKEDWDNVRKMIQEQASNYDPAPTGTGDAIAISLDPAPAAYVDGAEYKFKAASTNTVKGPTLNANGIGAKLLRDSTGSSALQIGYLIVNRIYSAIYNEVQDAFLVQTPPNTGLDLSDNSFDAATSVFSANDYTLTLTKPFGSLQDFNANSVIRFVADASNTGAVTITLGVNTDALVKKSGVALVTGDITSGDVVEIARRTLNGDFQLMSAGVRATDSDELVKISADDTTAGFLNGKLVSGDGIALTELNPAADEDLEVKVDIPGQAAGTVAGGDLLLIADIDDSNNPKKITAQSIRDLPVSQAEYVFAYDTTTQTVSVANTFQDITFSNNGEIDGWTHTVSTADFTANETGKYEVNMNFIVNDIGAGTPLFEFIGLVNGVEVAGSQLVDQLSVNNQETAGGKSFIINITSGQIFKIQMTATTTNAQIIAAGANAVTAVSASVTITRI